MPQTVVAELIELLQLERIEENLFRGRSQDLGFRQLFGGQVLGQCVSAANQTVEPARHVHSLHGYFLRPGDAGLPVMPSTTHIVPLMVGDPVKAKKISDILLAEYGIYVQPINYPTVPRGTERLRFTPGPAHDDGMMRELTQALVEIWGRLELRRAA